MFSSDERKMIDRDMRDMRRQSALDSAAMSFGDAGANSTADLIERAQACYDWLSRGEESARVTALPGRT